MRENSSFKKILFLTSFYDSKLDNFPAVLYATKTASSSGIKQTASHHAIC